MGRSRSNVVVEDEAVDFSVAILAEELTNVTSAIRRLRDDYARLESDVDRNNGKTINCYIAPQHTGFGVNPKMWSFVPSHPNDHQTIRPETFAKMMKYYMKTIRAEISYLEEQQLLLMSKLSAK